MLPGRYTFRMIVIDNTGNSWPEITEVDIELQQPKRRGHCRLGCMQGDARVALHASMTVLLADAR
jgi:hypothetical protein